MPKWIAGGAWVQIIADGRAIGLVQGASYDEDWGVTPANVLNHHGPMDYDSQGYSLQISIQTYIPEAPNSGPFPDGGRITMADLIPTRSYVQSNGGKPGEIEDLQFVNTATGAIVNQFRRAMIASNGVQIAPNSYISGNLRLMSVERLQ